jgi:hypothetical protein
LLTAHAAAVGVINHQHQQPLQYSTTQLKQSRSLTASTGLCQRRLLLLLLLL